LLSRTTRSVALTDPGRRLLEQAGTAVDQALEALKTVSARAGEVTGRIRLTLPAIAVPCARHRREVMGRARDGRRRSAR
jgi:DNA-binding transcriptional LysR family regulator